MSRRPITEVVEAPFASAVSFEGIPSEAEAAGAAPRVSIGMPVYQGAEHIREALDSLLRQVYSDFEIVISDNASTDDTEKICREYARRDRRIRYFRNERNLGAAYNYNRVFDLARGEYFKWMAHDDVIRPTYLSECVKVLDHEGEAVSLCFTGRRKMSYAGNLLDPDSVWSGRRAPYDDISFARLVRLRGAYYPTFVFGLARTAALARTGLIGPYGGADLTLVAELRLRGRFRQIPEDLYYERVRDLKERVTNRGELTWYDPTGTGRRFVLRGPRLLLEYWRAIDRSPLGAGAKFWKMVLVLIGLMYAAIELKIAPARRRLHRQWIRATVAAARFADRSSIPLRSWALVSFLARERAIESVRVVFQSWSRAESELLYFAAERLSRRSDPGCAALLREWLEGQCENRRMAARRAIGQRPSDDGG